MIRQFDKYSYKDLPQLNLENKRLYETPEGDKVPSVTTILSKTKDNSGLEKWARSIGEEKAERIRNEAAKVGTSMHLFLEEFITEIPREPITVPDPLHSQARQMANTIISSGLKYVTEVWGSETKLYYKDKYAGTTDVIGMYKDIPHIIDFKQTNKPKKAEWIEDYYLQLCAYSLAHNEMFGTDIKNGVVLMCSRDLQFQKFELNEIQFEKYTYMWFNRVDEYYDMIKS